MERFVHLQTGVGTSFTSSAFFGPFELQQDVEAFIEKAQAEFSKLGGNTCPMALCLVDELPEGRGALEPDAFQGFLKAQAR